MRRWHWISSAACLASLLLFAVTGFTLNHAEALEPPARTETRTLQLPPELTAALTAGPLAGAAPPPPPIAAWLGDRLDLKLSGVRAEWSEEEVTLSSPSPGVERAIVIERGSGAVAYERSSRGVLGALHDLHTGRNAGPAWALFTDVFAISCLLFAGTGLALAALHARTRPATWPLLACGAATPLILALLLILHAL